MAYRNDFRDRSLRLPIKMVRGNEVETETIESLVNVLEDELSVILREVPLEVAEFYNSDEVAWFMQQSGLQGKSAKAILQQALDGFRETARAARQMLEASDAMNYSSAGLPNRIPARVAHG